MSKSRNFVLTKFLKEEGLSGENESVPRAELTPEYAEGWLKKLFEKTGAVYVVGQLECCPDTKRLHIQACCNFKEPVRCSKLKKYDADMHIEAVKRDNGANEYCMKTETRVAGPWEFGVKPVRRNSKTDWEEVWTKAAAGKLDEIPASVRVIHYSKLKAIAKDHMKFADKDHLRGLWIFGDAGAGKSRWVREHCPAADLYPKLCNKWWDGYTGQRYVVMDDFGPQHVVLTQQLKIWADRYGCILETKGGAVADNYEWFIITSQYQPVEIFKDPKDLEAINRRFKIFNIKFIGDWDFGKASVGSSVEEKV